MSKKKDIPEDANLVAVKKDAQAALVKNEETDELELYCLSKSKVNKRTRYKKPFSTAI